ncbi:unnamed protein product [Symbiodinium necroappetens]|uniref:Uncharacterized protein n=1 Tax=Symbiodinium necroappetens TaxID=1628268 RepID=A0A812QKZ2_9DINO|nr:unnamed protein product [Symbiodinium necroappetens]
MAMLFPRGAVSLRALRELVQIRLNVSLVGRRSDIRRLAKKAAEEFSCGDRRIDGYAPVWEPLPKHSCLDRTWALDVAASDTKDRGRCLFSSLSDFGHGTIDNLEAKFQKAELLGTRHVVGDLGGFLPPSIRAANDVFCKIANDGLAMLDIIKDGLAKLWGGLANSTTSLLRALAPELGVWDPGRVLTQQILPLFSGAVRLVMKGSTLNDGGMQVFVNMLVGNDITLEADASTPGIGTWRVSHAISKRLIFVVSSSESIE